jgi:hypothetical protein
VQRQVGKVDRAVEAEDDHLAELEIRKTWEDRQHVQTPAQGESYSFEYQSLIERFVSWVNSLFHGVFEFEPRNWEDDKKAERQAGDHWG